MIYGGGIPSTPAQSAAAQAVAGLARGATGAERVGTLKELLTHAAAALQGELGHVETSETIYRLADAMCTSAAVPDFREI